MFDDLKKLGRETMIYGLSTVVARLINFLLTPLYTYYLLPAEYGIVATVFPYLAFLNVLYSYGLDSAFMRYASSNEGESRNFSTCFWSLAGTSLAASIFLYANAGPLTALADLPPEYSGVWRACAWILALDALALVPFAELRLTHRAGVYSGIKSANILINVVLNIVFVAGMDLGVKGVFLAALAASSATLTLLTPVIARRIDFRFDLPAWKTLLRFGLPLIPAGLASMAVQVIDRPLLKALGDYSDVGLYQANYRLGIFMMMAVSMFDAAWRPFFLQKGELPGGRELLAKVLTYFVLAASFLVLALSLFIPDIATYPLFSGKSLIHPSYWSGLAIVPVILLAYLFDGMHVNFLAPITLARKSEYAAYAAGLGALVNIAVNLALIPNLGIMGAALATLAAYAAMAGTSYILGRSCFPIPYEIGRIIHIAAIAVIFGAAAITAGGGENWFLRLSLCAGFPAALLATGFFTREELQALRLKR